MAREEVATTPEDTPKVDTTIEFRPEPLTPVEEHKAPPLHRSNSATDADHYAKVIKNKAEEFGVKARCNTTGHINTNKKSDSPLLQKKSEEQSSPKLNEEPPDDSPVDPAKVYHKTTSVVKSVIELNTGVQHAQPEEFVDLVKVIDYFFHFELYVEGMAGSFLLYRVVMEE